MTDILKDISTYNRLTHTPYPTLSYVLEQTGEDLIIAQGSETKAKAFVSQITDIAYNLLKDSKDSSDTINRLEYKIATDEQYRIVFLNYVCNLIYTMFNLGGADFLYADNGKKGLDRLPPSTKSFVSATVLGVGKFLPFEYEYRVGY